MISSECGSGGFSEFCADFSSSDETSSLVSTTRENPSSWLSSFSRLFLSIWLASKKSHFSFDSLSKRSSASRLFFIFLINCVWLYWSMASFYIWYSLSLDLRRNILVSISSLFSHFLWWWTSDQIFPLWFCQFWFSNQFYAAFYIYKEGGSLFRPCHLV